MKILMENKKKQLIYIGIMVVSLGVIAWLWLGSGSSSGPPAVGNVLTALTAGSSGNGSLQSLDAITTLPYGKTFKTEVFSDPRFKELVAPPRLDVKKEELGRENPFLPL